MLSNEQQKLIRSLRQKKHRRQHGFFVAEGDKIVRELLMQTQWTVDKVCALPEWMEQCAPHGSKHTQFIEVSGSTLARISQQKQPNQALAVVRIPQFSYRTEDLAGQTCLVLDRIQDPGNLGTIIRTADWFGIKRLFCSPDTADAFNPKVIQASMGSFMRVQVHHTPLPPLLRQIRSLMPVLGACLEGDKPHTLDLSAPIALVIGNESAGLSEEVKKEVTRLISIPRGGPAAQAGAESLNAAVATGILLAAIKRHE